MVAFGPVFVAKCGVLMAYYALVRRYFGDSTEGLLLYKYVTFNVASFLVKAKRFQGQPARMFLASFVYDVLFSTLNYWAFFNLLLPPMLFPPIIFIAGAVLEYSKHRFVDEPDKEYKITLSPNMLSNMSLVLILMVTYGLFQYCMDTSRFVLETTVTFPVFVFMVGLMDSVFGMIHYLEHKVAALYKKHKFHHTYKKQELNFFANFCSDFEDAFGMAFGFNLGLAFLCWTQAHHVALYDLQICLINTHCRYRGDSFNLIYFFEWDLIDICFIGNESERLSCYHHQHHQDHDKNFSAFGLVTDSALDVMLGGVANRLRDYYKLADAKKS